MRRKPITLRKEQIKETIDSTPEQRLTWLEEANRFLLKIGKGRK